MRYVVVANHGSGVPPSFPAVVRGVSASEHLDGTRVRRRSTGIVKKIEFDQIEAGTKGGVVLQRVGIETVRLDTVARRVRNAVVMDMAVAGRSHCDAGYVHEIVSDVGDDVVINFDALRLRIVTSRRAPRRGYRGDVVTKENDASLTERVKQRPSHSRVHGRVSDGDPVTA